MRIRVEKRHIEKGVPAEPDCCPIALALEDAGCAGPAVGLASVEWSQGGRRWTGRMDAASQDFVRSFDDGEGFVVSHKRDPRPIGEPFDCVIEPVRSREVKA